ncbi:MAG: hypothetical protein MUE95_13935 [Cyclobacteriaceae bacterium]|jgi:hypothetical protein|nr:hypothetical protein [Cyclobacteriaceae bacterium]
MKNFLLFLKDRNEVLYYFGLLCLVAAAISLILTKVTTIQVLGTSAWNKPFKFLLSSAIFVWSMGWYLHYLGPSASVTWYSRGMIFLLTIEYLYILLQAARGMTSHFNVTTSGNATWWGIMAFAAVSISLWTLVVSIPFFTRSFPELPPAYIWGIRMGLIVFVIFSLQGLSMGARMAHSVGGPDGTPGLPVVNWSKSLGDLRIAHFMGMHALQVIPLLAFYLFRSATTAILFGIAYGVLSTALWFQAMNGKSILTIFRFW